VIDCQEMVRQFRMGRSDRAIARDLSAGRNTVAMYKAVAKARGWLAQEGPVPSLDEINKAFQRDQEDQNPAVCGPVSTVAVHEETVKALRREGVEMMAIWQILRDSHGFTGSYSAVRRFVRKLEPCTPEAFVRIETKPGEEAQVDFGFAGKFKDPRDGKFRKAWIFLMTLSWSRHQYAEIVFDQKVESGVRYIKRNALAGREFRDINHGNEHLQAWVVETAGVRIHGTTHEKPLERFHDTEKAKLRPLPPTRYEVGVWKQVKLHPDCHVVFDYAYYSAPHRLVGQTLMIRATAKKVELYHNHEHVAVHSRAAVRGERKTILDHLPPAKVQGLMPVPQRVREEAALIGPYTGKLVDQLLGDRPVDRLRGAQGIVSMARKHGAVRLEKACRRALCFDDVQYRTVLNILRKGLESEPLPDEEFASNPLPKTSIHARSAQEFRAYS